MCVILEERHYRGIPTYSMKNLRGAIRESACRGVILDLDTVPVDNRVLRELRRQNPGIGIVGLSERRFHPELEEAIRSHIYACLGKPPDPDELVYWLRSIYENDEGPKDLSVGKER